MPFLPQRRLFLRLSPERGRCCRSGSASRRTGTERSGQNRRGPPTGHFMQSPLGACCGLGMPAGAWAGAVRGEPAHEMPGAGSRGRAPVAGLRGSWKSSGQNITVSWKQGQERGKHGLPQASSFPRTHPKEDRAGVCERRLFLIFSQLNSGHHWTRTWPQGTRPMSSSHG